jgi:S1-C subfamily serine protease
VPDRRDHGSRPEHPCTAGVAAGPPGAWPLPDIVRRIEPSVVAVLTEAGEGSGVVWSEDGLVVTNNHVVQGARNFTLAFADGKRSPATVVATDPVTDPAILRSDRKSLPKAVFAPSLPDVGALVVAVGNSRILRGP